MAAINIKYCGGCNPRYDRTQIAKRIQKEFPDETIRVNSTQPADAAVILCGCSAACAVAKEEREDPGVYVMWREEELEELLEFLRNSVERLGRVKNDKSGSIS